MASTVVQALVRGSSERDLRLCRAHDSDTRGEDSLSQSACEWFLPPNCRASGWDVVNHQIILSSFRPNIQCTISRGVSLSLASHQWISNDFFLALGFAVDAYHWAVALDCHFLHLFDTHYLPSLWKQSLVFGLHRSLIVGLFTHRNIQLSSSLPVGSLWTPQQSGYGASSPLS